MRRGRRGRARRHAGRLPLARPLRLASRGVDTGQYVAYTFYRVDPAWRRLPVEERAAGQGRVRRGGRVVGGAHGRRCAPTPAPASGPTATSSSGRSPSATTDLGELGAELNATPLAGWLETPYSYLATTKASQYTSARKPRKITPHDQPYLVVYPFVKVRPWYALSEEDRQRAMDEHIRIGREEFPGDPQPHDVLVRDRRPGVHDRVRVRRARRLHAPDAAAARQRGEPLHRARHADLRRAARPTSALRSTRWTALRRRRSAAERHACAAVLQRRCAGRARFATSRTRRRRARATNATASRPVSSRNADRGDVEHDQHRRTVEDRARPSRPGVDVAPVLAPEQVAGRRRSRAGTRSARSGRARRASPASWSATITAAITARIAKPRSVRLTFTRPG